MLMSCECIHVRFNAGQLFCVCVADPFFPCNTLKEIPATLEIRKMQARQRPGYYKYLHKRYAQCGMAFRDNRFRKETLAVSGRATSRATFYSCMRLYDPFLTWSSDKGERVNKIEYLGWPPHS